MGTVKQQYFNPKLSGSYSGFKGFFGNRKFKDKQQTKDELERIKEYYLFKPINRKFKRRPVQVDGPENQIVFDLIDIQQYAKANNGYKYILIVIDAFSKKLWAAAIKNKSATSVLKTLKQLFKKMNFIPKFAQSDDGKEFINASVQNYFKQLGVRWFSTKSIIKASIVERVIRTIMTRLSRVFSHRNSNKYIDVLQNIVNSYNNTTHSSTKFKPNDVNSKNADIVWFNLYGKTLVKPNTQKPKYSVGSFVRIDRQKAMFEKGYSYNWNPEVFVIREVKLTNPITYLLKDLQNELIVGQFYEPELQLAADHISIQK